MPVKIRPWWTEREPSRVAAAHGRKRASAASDAGARESETALVVATKADGLIARVVFRVAPLGTGADSLTSGNWVFKRFRKHFRNPLRWRP
jgi:hypothetical protein